MLQDKASTTQLHSLQKNQAISRILRFSLHTSDFKIPTLRMQSEQHVNADPYITGYEARQTLNCWTYLPDPGHHKTE